MNKQLICSAHAFLEIFQTIVVWIYGCWICLWMWELTVHLMQRSMVGKSRKNRMALYSYKILFEAENSTLNKNRMKGQLTILHNLKKWMCMCGGYFSLWIPDYLYGFLGHQPRGLTCSRLASTIALQPQLFSLLKGYWETFTWPLDSCCGVTISFQIHLYEKRW